MTYSIYLNLFKKTGLVFIFSVWILSWSNLVLAQPPLETLLHLDKPFYVSGETVWFKLYLPFTWKDKDVALNTTLLGPAGNLMDQFFIRTEGKTFIEGYYQIPFDQKSGWTEIQFTASGLAQEPESLIAHYTFPVYNDLELPENPELVEQPSKIEDPVLVTDGIKLNITLLNGKVTCRDEIRIKLEAVDNAGNPVTGHASVSVKERTVKACTPSISDIQTLPLSYTINQHNLKSKIYTRGFLRHQDGSPLQMNVLAGYAGRDERVYYSKSFDDGHYEIELPDFTGKKIIQLIGFQYEKPDLRSNKNSPERLDKNQNIIYTEPLLKYLELSRLRKKIYQHFESVESASNPDDIIIPRQDLKPDARYSVKEYESFKDMKSFFGELLTPLRFRLEKDSTYTASLFNAKGGRRSNTILNGPPLFIIDGKMTRDADFVARLPISAVETVELFLDAPKLRSYFQAIGVSGVIKISTSIANLKLPEADAGNIHMVHGLQPRQHFPEIQALYKDPSSRQPFFRPQLFWKPDISIGEDGSADFSFTQSDDTGSFELQVVFQAEDGTRVLGGYQYEVNYP